MRLLSLQKKGRADKRKAGYYGTMASVSRRTPCGVVCAADLGNDTGCGNTEKRNCTHALVLHCRWRSRGRNMRLPQGNCAGDAEASEVATSVLTCCEISFPSCLAFGGCVQIHRLSLFFLFFLSFSFFLTFSFSIFFLLFFSLFPFFLSFYLCLSFFSPFFSPVSLPCFSPLFLSPCFSPMFLSPVSLPCLTPSLLRLASVL